MSAWPRVRLDEYTEVVSGATPDTTEPGYWGGDICWATPKDLSDLEGAYISDTPRKITRRGLESCAASVLPPESVLFSSRAPIGHVAINTVPMATNQGFKSFLPDRRRVDSKFLYHWLRKNRPYLESLGNGATFKEVSKAVVSRIEIPLPPLPEQRRIAEILDKADALRVKRRAALAQLDTLTRSIFLDMFGDPATNSRGWPISKLGELISVGPQNGLYRPASDYGSGTPILRIDAFYDGVVTGLATLKRVRISSEEIALYGLRPGEIVVNRVNSREYLGKSALIPDLPEPTVFESNMMRFGVDAHRLHPVYLIARPDGRNQRGEAAPRLGTGSAMPGAWRFRSPTDRTGRPGDETANPRTWWSRAGFGHARR
jgi:type I restriction enzyme S subunit